jgi:hypothetical protein
LKSNRNHTAKQTQKRFQTIPIDTGQSHQLNQHLVHDLTSAIDHLDWVIL